MRYFLIFCLFSTSLLAQELRSTFQSYTSEDGLGGEAINDLLVDQYGYLWSAAFSGLHRFDGYNFLAFPANILDSCSLSHPIATSLMVDQQGSLWVGTKGGLNRLDRETNCFQRFFHQPQRAGSLPNNDIRDLVQTTNGNYYIATATTLTKFLPATEQFVSIPTTVSPQQLQTKDTLLIVGGPEGLELFTAPNHQLIPFPEGIQPAIFDVLITADTFLVATNRGLYRWSPGVTTLQPALAKDHPLAKSSIQNLHLTDEFLWLATRGDGLGRIHRTSRQFTQFFANRNTLTDDLLDNHTRVLTTDDHGHLWIGGYSGLNRLNLSPTAPRLYQQSKADGQLPQLLEIGSDANEGILFYERLRGLFYAEKLGQKAKLLNFPTNDFLIDKDLNHIYTDRGGTTWLLRGRDQLYRFSTATKAFLPPIVLPSFKSRRLNAISQDLQQDHIFWMASSAGLGRLDVQAKSVSWFLPGKEVGKLSGFVLTVVQPGRDGKIWLSCGDYYNDRLGFFDPKTEKFTFLEYAAGDPKAIAGGRIKQLASHPDGSIWAAASQGIIRIEPKALAATLITEVKGIPVGIPEAILVDDRGYVWFSAGDKIGRYLPTSNRLSLITCPSAKQFSNGAATVTAKGQLLFAGLGGIMAVNPKHPLLNGNFPQIVFNGISINGQTTTSLIPDITALSLQLGERNIGLYFAGLYYDRARYIEYAFRINRGPWQQLGQNRSLAFTDLRPGEHLLEIRASDGQANWSPFPRRLTITVPYYWHETSVARWCFILLSIAILSLLGRQFLRRKLERQAHEQLQALDAFKSRLFTDLTHEFRTPLTLILGPARRLRERAQTQNDSTLGREARRIDRQGRRLLSLINQLLDLRKLDAGQLKVERSASLLTPFFRALTESFRLEALQKEIKLEFINDSLLPPNQAVAIDRTKQESIFQNLLSNALKFTPVGGHIRVRLKATKEEWSLEVADTGCGIAPEQQGWIFQRFARAHGADIGGSGIGLSFVRDLTNLLAGEISLNSEVEVGTTFLLTFPTQLSTEVPALEMASLPSTPEVTPLTTVAEDAPLILVVEDEDDVATYLEESLKGNYQVLVANDGLSGLAIAQSEIPDLVISDVMMPQLNGLQLCARLKADPRTSHLPVLLLTARSAEEHRIEGLDRGADAYLNKPFSERELHLIIRNLLMLRDRLAARLQKEFLAAPETDMKPTSPREAGWLTDLRNYIADRMDDPDLSGADLEQHLGMSRSQLQRKLQSVLGLSPRKLVNEVRLETAARALQQSAAPISQVAYDCGFRDPKYFSRIFKERFGLTPGKWREQSGVKE